ncbi:MAG: threonine ammonia-lyase [Bacteroidales bacterium]|nr:threonine ammonia-lyase [Bacteroidales bacterium]MDD2425191.1 threonine ammonia-lyase [Bacteroidales bacterium]MDD3989045.1 threonine ammonia-lyase [Bacteroidales bacterium]MDD4639254.1 threonine ammonia-lyase [Bacteroidales bacterium]
MSYFPALKDISQARLALNGDVCQTPLTQNAVLSVKFGANVLLKREDLQIVRSYKIRGALNKIKSLSKEQMKRGVVCASAGNHAQGVAFSCNKLGIKGSIYMPVTTPKQKIQQVRMFGKEFVEVVLTGDTFDDANKEAVKYCEENKKVFIHPFDDPRIIEGQGTIGIEIMQQSQVPVDYLFIPVGGGGLASGLGAYFKQISPDTKIIGVEPSGAASMAYALRQGKTVALDRIDSFIDGAAVKKAGELTFEICKKVLDDIISVQEGAVCSTILNLYNLNAIVAEPAGALSIAALDCYADKIRGKNVVCIVSGSNNDITRMEEIRERSLLYEGLKHYFIVRFPQRSGALLSFIRDVLGPGDDITYFSYSKKTNREQGPAVLGIELAEKSDFEPLLSRLNEKNIKYEYLNDKPDLFSFLIL